MVNQHRFHQVIPIAVIGTVLSSFPAISAEAPDRLEMSAFDEKSTTGWEEKRFSGQTRYKVIKLDDEYVLQADSRKSASGLYKKVTINLRKHPYLNWRWRISSKIKTADHTTRTGDDYAARIYVVVDGGLLFWKSRALSYVWASQAGKGEQWNNAYAGKSVKMLAVRSATDSTSSWYTEKRNVYEDMKKLFGKEISTIDAVALMTDTDDSGSDAISYYADIYFSAD